MPKARWTHEAHLLVGLTLARRHPEASLLPVLREAIAAYNLAVGGENTDTAGYHETITAFYVALMSAVARDTAEASLAEAAGRLLAGPLADRALILRCYSPAALASPEARRAALPPDVAAFDPEALVAEAFRHAQPA